jgi:hypothetical protein
MLLEASGCVIATTLQSDTTPPKIPKRIDHMHLVSFSFLLMSISSAPITKAFGMAALAAIAGVSAFAPVPQIKNRALAIKGLTSRPETALGYTNGEEDEHKNEEVERIEKTRYLLEKQRLVISFH